MNIAIYRCDDKRALDDLTGNMDQGESMDVTALSGEAYLVVYRSPHLVSVATDPDITGVTLVSQGRTV